jgi:glycosyltransferase involved in cell wall biosynthesis/ubiquinone/menaquinone biosynthesis C-methylase UbiE
VGKINSLVEILARAEQIRTQHETALISTFKVKYHSQASAVRHLFHLLPGETILVLGTGTADWCNTLARVVGPDVRVTAAFFAPELYESARCSLAASVKPYLVQDLASDLQEEAFDYVVGCRMLFHAGFPEALANVRRVLKPGGQMLFFEQNVRHPWRRVETGGKFFGSLERVMRATSHQGFTHIDLLPYDLLPDFLGPRTTMALKSKTLVFEHAPFVCAFTRTMLMTGRKPGVRVRPLSNLANHAELADAISVVVPCRNEAPNIGKMVERLIALYGPYIHEVVLVNDNSRDNTAEMAADLAKAEPRVRVINRSMPNGVGRALRDGYRAATGRYILSLDCDFVEILPELRDMFDAVAGGRGGAIGSRFSHDSVLINYPFGKLVFNRAFHTLIKLGHPVRDITNNLKLYRAEILQNLEIESPHFSANLETGLKPLLAGYDIEEVPMSWINRTIEMGTSSFTLRKVGYDYVRALFRIWREYFLLPKSSSTLFGLPISQQGISAKRRRAVVA